MFEFQVSVSEDNAKVAKQIFLDLKKVSDDLKMVVTSYSEHNKIFVVVGCDEIEKPRLNFILGDIISDAISTFYKMEYIDENLRVPISNVVNISAFKKALVAFDRETDKYIITRVLKFEREVNLDALYNFRLKSLRSKWQEIIKLANDNASYLLCNDTFVDLLKFLIDNIEISRGLVNVVKEEERYKLCDENFNEISRSDCPLSCLEEIDDGGEINLITSLIALSPKKINVYCNAFENSPTLTLISQIFENRISILPAR
ncbi:MAG: sporulation protein YtxC [Eubacteriales bacterium]|nr:sporulation protein YtxC [Eubacteriales bacterium]